MANRQGSKTCFVAMPISTRAAEFELFRDQDHWGNVFTYLIAPAVEAAGYTVVAPGRESSEHITKAIVTQVSTADIMLPSSDGPAPALTCGDRPHPFSR